MGFIIGGPDTDPPHITVYNGGRGASVPPDNTLESAPWLVGQSTPVFMLSDSGSGLSFLALTDQSGELISWQFYDGAATAEAQFSLPSDKPGYMLLVGDNAGNESRLYFHVDRYEPKLEFSAINVNVSGDYYSFDVYGTATDTASGIAAGPVMLTNAPQHGDLGVHNTGATYPVLPESSTATFTHLNLNANGGHVKYMFLAADKADNLGRNELWLTDQVQYWDKYTLNDYWYTEYIAGLPYPDNVVVHEGVRHLPGVPSGWHLVINSITLTDPQRNCYLSGDKTGMSATVSINEYTPDAQEKLIYQGWDNIPLQAAGPVAMPAPIYATESKTLDLDLRLPQYTAFNVTKTANVHTLQNRCHVDSDGNGVPDTWTTADVLPGQVKYGVELSIHAFWTDIVGPRVIYQEWVTPNLSAVVKAGIIEVEIDDITAPGRVTVSRGQYDPGIPDYRTGSEAYDVDIDAPYAGDVRVTFYINMSGLTEKQKREIAIFHNPGSGWVNSTTAIGVSSITYVGRTASPFIVMVPIDDSVAPQTSFSLIGASAELNSKTYISSSTLVELRALDTALNPADVTGFATTYYLINAEPTAECLATPYNPDAVPGTCANSIYAWPITLAEGVHTVSYYSVDKAGNYETPKSKVLYVDGTAPKTTIIAGGVAVVDGGSAYIADSASVALVSVDQTSNGVASLENDIYYLIDTTLESCGDMSSIVSTAAAGSCQNPVYTEPFILRSGTHTVYYASTDNVGNRALMRTAEFTVTVSTELAAFSVTPSSGPIGQPIVVTGSGFGAYSAAASRVLLSGSTIQITSWTNARVAAKVPGRLSPGAYELSVGRLIGGVWSFTNSLGFTITSPDLASVSPSSGPIGQAIVLSGSGFGQNGGAAVSRVLLGGATAQVTSWTDSRIAAKIPGTLAPGDYGLVVERLFDGATISDSVAPFVVTAPDIASVVPSSGPIGQPVVIAGSGFGRYISSIATRVLLGDTTVQVTSWTDAKITAKVPGSLSTLAYELVVERNFEGGTSRDTAGPFTVTAPGLEPLDPSSGPIGQVIQITGSGFGRYISSATTRVLLGGEAAPVSSWTDAKIMARVPGELATGGHELIVERMFEGSVVRDSTGPFIVTVPAIASVVPSSGPIGQLLIITGSSFGQYLGTAATRVLFGETAAQVVSWTDVKITARIPGALAAGDYQLAVDRAFGGGAVHASTGPFIVTVPEITSVAVSSGPIGQPIVIIGSGFGQYGGALLSRVLFGDTTAQVTSWTDMKITAKVPATLAPGDYALLVERLFDGAAVTGSIGSFLVTTPEIGSVNLSSGPIGQPIIISGSGFGQYGGAAVSRVLLGDTTAQVVSWLDSRIMAKVPGSLVPGSYGLVVERLYDGAAVSDSIGSFLVTTPDIASVSLSSGPIGQPVVIGGSGFGQYGGIAVSRVLLGDATAQIASWTDSRIIAKVPGALGVGDYPLSIERLYEGARVSDPAGTFTVTAPVITSVVPSSGPIGQAIALSGAGFGQYGGAAVSHLLFGDTTAQITSWRDSAIIARVPPALTAGDYQLTVERVFGGDSVSAAAGTFAVIVPSAQPAFPSSGPVASVFSIPGAGFGKYVSSSATRVLIGGVPAPLTYWSDTLIRGRLPYLPAGEYPVVMERVFGGAAVSSPAGTMTLLEPVMAGLSPAAGKEGSLFTVYGAGFGAYYSGKVNGETAVRVKLGGLSCRISSWSDTRIRALVPSPMPAGGYPVRVERATTYGGGCAAGCAVFSNELVYEVAAGTFAASAVRRLAAVPYSATEPADQTAELPVSARWGGYVATGGGAAVSVPENAIPGLQSDTLSDDGGIFLPDEVAEDYLGEGSSGESSQEAMPSETIITISSDQSGAEDQAARQAAMGGANLAPAGPAVVYGPEGLEFLTPVEMTLPCSPVMLAAAQSGLQDVAVYVWEPVPGRWSELPGVSTSTAGGVCAVKGLAAHFSLYQVLARLTVPAASADFRLGEVYVYPDPAKGGKVPTFHIEAGIADKVTLRIYTVSGRLVHEREMTGTPPIIDDGNGQSYAYEYAWAGHIPSGVYHYVVTSEKAGRKLRARGRFAVVR